ncbi:Uncharacterised protein [Vibrio cholerae]|nr:Uncharacterised protein [Vibrio cholerae]CSA94883.1 Uncharacterised protein [Vibrio cholerae]CSB16703.1 Uncharacterised protein [Vibrio cholerae]CSB55265.1 Uncharacterised protein [Vibrio cholerae]CSC44280.1 Uncharacterised protein [Vibrio cholerae]
MASTMVFTALITGSRFSLACLEIAMPKNRQKTKICRMFASFSDWKTLVGIIPMMVAQKVGSSPCAAYSEENMLSTPETSTPTPGWNSSPMINARATAAAEVIAK